MPYRRKYRPRAGKPYRKRFTRYRKQPLWKTRRGTMKTNKYSYLTESSPVSTTWNYARRGFQYVKYPRGALQVEKKLLSLTPQNSAVTTTIQALSSASHVGFVLGTKPSAWNGTFHNLHGFIIPKGDDQDERNGQYVYISHSNIFLNLETSTTSVTGNTPPCEFRCIVFRARRATNPAGVVYDPANSLFLDDLGNTIGHTTLNIDGTDLMSRMLNRRDWIIKSDRKFILSRPLITDSDGGQVQYSGKYPVMKNMRIKIPFYKKVRYGIDNLPQDLAYHWGVVIYCRALAKESGTAGDWECNVRGQTVFLDP